MRLEKVDLNLFVVFDAIYREGSITRVAQQLHLTQPAVSNALGRLRQSFDDQLFVRTPDGMIPTPVADNVIGDVRRALALLSKSVGVNARFDPATSEKRFRLGMHDLAQLLLLPELLRRVRQQARGIALACYYQDRQHTADELRSGNLDILLDAPPVNAREFEHQSLLDLPYVVAMNKSHPLAAESLTLDAYLSAEHVHVSSRRKGRGHADVALHGLGHKRAVALRVQHYLVAAEIVRHSELLWTVPETLARRLDLHLADLPLDVEPLQIQLYWSKSANDDPANRWIRELIATAAAELHRD